MICLSQPPLPLNYEVFLARLENEFSDIKFIATLPSIKYRVFIKETQQIHELTNSLDYEKIFKDQNTGRVSLGSNAFKIYEPFINSTIILPTVFAVNTENLISNYKGEIKNREYLGSNLDRLILTVRFPISEIMTDFHSKLKSITRGLGSFDYEEDGYDLCSCNLIEVLINGQNITELSHITSIRIQEKIVEKLTNSLKKNIKIRDFPQNVKIYSTLIGGDPGLGATNDRTKVSEFRIKAGFTKDKIIWEHKGDLTRLQRQLKDIKSKHKDRMSKNEIILEKKALIDALKF